VRCGNCHATLCYMTVEDKPKVFGPCAGCGRITALRVDGKVAGHRECTGSGALPADQITYSTGTVTAYTGATTRLLKAWRNAGYVEWIDHSSDGEARTPRYTPREMEIIRVMIRLYDIGMRNIPVARSIATAHVDACAALEVMGAPPVSEHTVSDGIVITIDGDQL